MQQISQNQLEWARPSDGIIFGVCRLFARRLHQNIWAARIVWLLSVVCLGGGIFAYLILAFALPKQGSRLEAMRPRVLGVCSRISERTQNEVGLIRLLTLLTLIVSGGSAILVYGLLSVLLPRKAKLPS